MDCARYNAGCHALDGRPPKSHHKSPQVEQLLKVPVDNVSHEDIQPVHGSQDRKSLRPAILSYRILGNPRPHGLFFAKSQDENCRLEGDAPLDPDNPVR